MKGMLLVSSVAVLAVIFTLERSLIWLAPVAVVAMILGVFMIAQQRHPFRGNAVQIREFPVCGDVRTVAKDLEVGHRASAGTAAQKGIPVLPVKDI
jgi:hypothetical protein